MVRLLTPYFLMIVCISVMRGHTGYAQQYWNFSVEVAIDKQTAEYYQRTTSKDIKTIVSEQLATVTANFNIAKQQASPNFNGILNFYLDTIYVFDGNTQNELNKPQTKRNYKVIINGFATDPSGGGWYGSTKTIYHNWKWNYFDGPFAKYATDGLTHEFGHARGAIDLYALKVDADKNKISNSAFEPPNSIMNYPYDNIIWDAYTVNILNATGGSQVINENYITTAFPKNIAVKLSDYQGIELGNSSIDVFPVEWFSNSLTSTPLLTASTDNKGLYQLPYNPFQPGLTNYPWHIKYCNFLIKVTHDSDIQYGWMPLYDVQNTYFTYGANATHVVNFTFPSKVVPIKIVAINSASFCPGDSIRVNFSTSSLFNSTNSFDLQLSDAGGNSTTFTRIGSVTGNGETTISGLIPPSALAGNSYKIRIVSTSPYIESEALSINIKSLPTAPIITLPSVVVCQATSATIVAASGQNLNWYTSSSGGTGVETLRPTTDVAGTKSYYVSQTIDGCEGPRTSVTVTVKSKPAPPLIADQAICQQFCRSASSCDYLLIGSATQAAKIQWYSESGSQYQQLPGRFATNYIILYVNEVGWRIGANALSASQLLDGCESDRTPFTLTLNQNQEIGPGNSDGRSTAVCQNSGSYTLDKFVGPAPIGFQNYYYDPKTGVGSTLVPTISTSTAATYSFETGYISDKGCISPKRTNGVIYALVKPLPTKPAVTDVPQLYCQYQTANQLSAKADANASLIWYGTSATEGTGSATAPKPATDQPGTFRYYVAQSLNACEGERAEILVTVKSTVPQPSVIASVAYCRNQITNPLSATGTQLRWVLPTNQSVSDTPSPSAQTVGTVSYFFTQTVDGCESNRAEIKVTIKRTPDAPGTFARTLCQNETAPLLAADGQGLKWYSGSSGGDASSTAPAVNTGQAGQTTYYVSQSIDGCEGPRAALVVTIKTLPAAPGVTKKDICQFAQSDPLSATGSGLIWYDTDGRTIGNTGPTPATDKGATFAYQVSQTIDGCTGPKATLTVTIMTTPLPALAKTILELCKGSNPSPLEASGTSLKWTDPTGTISTTAPVPFTTEPTKNPDGDAYYVTQTGANGCESQRATIRVFVQGPPTLALSGATTINLGIEAPISLKFTGVGPYQYKIQPTSGQPLSGSAVKDTTILVLPTRTTTYQVIEVSNRCGVGLPVSTATVIVVVPTIQTQALASSTVCAGNTLTANFATTGQFNSGSSFKLQLARFEADTSKIQYIDLPNLQVVPGQVSASIPSTATSGTYLVRVVATNPRIPILGTPSATTLTIRPLPGAALSASQTVIYEGDAVKLSVVFNGDGPWTFSYRDSSSIGNTVREVLTNANPHVLDLKPQKSTTYRLTSLSNGCGSSLTLPTSVQITVNPLLAIEELDSQVKIFPVPVLSTLTVQIDPTLMKGTATIVLVNLQGVPVLRQETKQLTSQLILNELPAGVYVIQVRTGELLLSRRISKR
ncbi:MAG: T9SS type A sorting domain-containing protein [Cytophagaceae bacterium]|nr:MAG: T9SS type A sorting domain-containing protein [Cytophagaceae bacterium]